MSTSYYYEVDKERATIIVFDMKTKVKLTEITSKELEETHSQKEVRDLIIKKLCN